MQVLFVGNSLTYVGNLPAVLQALAVDNGRPLHADMLVKGGATLTEWLDSGAVPRALAAGHYDRVVLQERGNDFACGFGPQVCEDSRHALQVLAGVIRKSGAKPILLGTYEPDTKSAMALVGAEDEAARADGMPYIAVSNRFVAALKRYPQGNWVRKDHHPGHDLVLLEAVLLYRQLYGTVPRARALVVRAPMFVPGSKFAAPAPVSMPLLPEVPLAGEHDYSRDELAAAIALAGDH